MSFETEVEKIVEGAKADVEKAIRAVVPAVTEGAKIAADVRSLDVSALIADIEDVIHGHLSAAGIADTSGNLAPGTKADTTEPTGDPAGITRTVPDATGEKTELPPDVAAGLGAETSAEPSGLPAADVAGSMGADAAQTAPGDPEGITRAVPGQQG